MDIKDVSFLSQLAMALCVCVGGGQGPKLLSQAVAPMQATEASEEARAPGSRMGRHSHLKRVHLSEFPVLGRHN